LWFIPLLTRLRFRLARAQLHLVSLAGVRQNLAFMSVRRQHNEKV
jgi:hypothetical protein